jgi:hypothetical protein
MDATDVVGMAVGGSGSCDGRVRLFYDALVSTLARRGPVAQPFPGIPDQRQKEQNATNLLLLNKFFRRA